MERRSREITPRRPGHGPVVLRWQLGFGLRETKEIVERIKRGEIDVEAGKPSKPCPHCKGSGVAQD